jgi:hypothetical protein
MPNALDIAAQGTLSPYEPSFRERAANALNQYWYGDTRKGQEQANRLLDVLDMTGLVSMGNALWEGPRGNPLNTAMAFVPGPAKKGIRAFHGSRSLNIQKFNPDAYRMGGRADSSALGTFFTTDPRLGKEAAQHYASRGGRVYEVDIDANIYDMTPQEFASLGSRRDFRQLRERLAAEGYDGVRLPENVSQAGEVAVWNPDKIMISH